MARIDRLLNIIAALQNSRIPLTAEQLRTRVPGYKGLSDDSFHRAFERDKTELRDIGIPVETVTVDTHESPRAGYTIDRDAYELADPGLTPEELAALHLAATAMRFEGASDREFASAIWKLGGAESEAVPDAVGSVEAPDVLPDLFAAVADRRQITFTHKGHERTLQPYRLEFARGHWYVTGHDPDRGEGRSFRVDRVSRVHPGDAGAFERPAEIGGVRLSPWEYGDGPARTSRIAVDAAIAASVLAENRDLTVVERNADGGVVIELEVRDVVGARNFVLSYLDRVEVLGPADLRADVVDWVRSLAEATP